MISRKIIKLDKLFDNFVKRRFIYLFVFVLLFSVFLRVSFLDYDSMWIDETISSVAAKSIVETGQPVLGSGEIYSRAELFHYLMAFFILVFGGDFGARFVSVVFGVFTVVLAYFFSKRFIDKPFSNLVFPLIVAISSIEIIYSKQARFYQAFQFFYFLSVYFFFKLLSSKSFNEKRMNLFFWVFATLGTIHLHSMGVILLPIYAGAFLIHKFRFRDLKKASHVAFYVIILLIFHAFLFWILSKYESLITVDELSRVILYSGLYTNFLYSWLPILVLSVLGLLIALKDDFRKNIILALFVFVPVLGIFATKFFATRYVYFSIFLILFYLVYLLEKLHLKYFVLLLLIVIYSGTMFSVSPIKEPRLDYSMPLADYKGAYGYVLENDELDGYPVVTTWTPAAMWYGNGSSFWINYSLSGTGSDWQIKNGVEVYSGNEIIYAPADFPEESVLVLDAQGARKMDDVMMRFIETHCVPLNESYHIQVMFCTRE